MTTPGCLSWLLFWIYTVSYSSSLISLPCILYGETRLLSASKTNPLVLFWFWFLASPPVVSLHMCHQGKDWHRMNCEMLLFWHPKLLPYFFSCYRVFFSNMSFCSIPNMTFPLLRSSPISCVMACWPWQEGHRSILSAMASFFSTPTHPNFWKGKNSTMARFPKLFFPNR